MKIKFRCKFGNALTGEYVVVPLEVGVSQENVRSFIEQEILTRVATAQSENQIIPRDHQPKDISDIVLVWEETPIADWFSSIVVQ